MPYLCIFIIYVLICIRSDRHQKSILYCLAPHQRTVPLPICPAILHGFSLSDLRHLRLIQTGVPMNTAVGKISVHTVDLRQVSGTADRAHIHFQLLMTTVVTVCKRKVHALIISQIHGSADQCTDGFFIVADGITYILDLTTIAKLPETSLQILFLDWGYVLCYMTVETVAYIWSVRNPFNNSVHLTELLYLQATETLCRRSVDCVKVTVFLLILIYLVIDIFQNFQGKSTILCNGFSIVKLLQQDFLQRN